MGEIICLEACAGLVVDFSFFNCRGANPPACDSGTGQNSRWRLRYDVYQYFLPENNLSEMVLMSHIRKMSEVQSIKANGVKVSMKHQHTRCLVVALY